jgi:hypothetical protein
MAGRTRTGPGAAGAENGNAPVRIIVAPGADALGPDAPRPRFYTTGSLTISSEPSVETSEARLAVRSGT